MIFTFFTGFSRTFGLKSRTNHGFSREHMRADSRNLEQTRNVEQTRNLEQMAWQSSNVATLKKCLAYASLGLTAAAAWMKQISEETEGWHLCAFTGAYLCIADVAVHVGHHLRAMATDA